MNVSDLRNLIHNVYKVKSDSMDLGVHYRLIKSGLGFFPYGSGLLIENNTELPKNGLMIVGQDFGNTSYILSDIVEKGESDKPTFRKIAELITGYPKEKVFLTNLFMGLRKDAGMIGDNPALKQNEIDYLKASAKFFNSQIEFVNPSKIIVLGKIPYNFICSHFNATEYRVKTFGSYKAEIISHNFPRIKNIQTLCIPHPSMWNSNVKNPKEWNLIIRDFLAIS